MLPKLIQNLPYWRFRLKLQHNIMQCIQATSPHVGRIFAHYDRPETAKILDLRYVRCGIIRPTLRLEIFR